jgi:phosphomannomutase
MDPAIFKAYDIRGLYPDQFSLIDGYLIAQAYAGVMKPMGPVAVGWDVRLHSKEIADQVIEGLLASGIDVVSIGLVSTEMLYFAVGSLNLGGGIMVTASHNPAKWHGLKLVGEGVEPISEISGLREIKNLVFSSQFQPSLRKGNYSEIDILDSYVKFILSLIKPHIIKPMKVVYNPNFGFQGKVFETAVSLGNLPLQIFPLNSEPDGHFPKGRPDPLIPENRIEFIELVKSTQADLGIAWDADADRTFFCADTGLFLEPYYTNMLLIEYLLRKYPREEIIHDSRAYWGIVETIKHYGGIPLLERVGHSFIKKRMRQENAILAVEGSGHTYFRNFWFAESGLLTALIMLELLSEKGARLSKLVQPYIDQYPISGEINNEVNDPDEVLRQIEAKYADAKIDHFDGLSIEYPDWRANIRKSQTESLLRLNIEAKTKELVNQKCDELLKIIRTD